MRKSAKLFLELYAETLDKGDSLKQSGLGARDIRKMTEPRFLDYDEEFTEGLLEVEEALKAAMLGIALEVAHSDGRQKLSAAKFVHGEAEGEVQRVEKAHIRWLQDQAKERALAGRTTREVGSGDTLTIEEMKSGGGSFARLTE